MHQHIFMPNRPTGCQGFAASTKKQCRRSNMSGSKFCDKHVDQTNKCNALKRNGLRCLENIINRDGRSYFCEHHYKWATPDEAVCQGDKLDGTPCYRRVMRDDYNFCYWKHDPRIRHFSPSSLRLQASTRPIGGTDRYHPDRDLMDGEENHKDHIDELQRMTFAMSFANFEDSEEEDDVTAFARDELMNLPFNLCYTLSTTNVAKGKATTSFLNDVMVHSMNEYDRPDFRALRDVRSAAFDVPIVVTFTDRLRAQGLGRDSTRLISREMETAMSTIIHNLWDQGETPIYRSLASASAEIGKAMGLQVQGRHRD